MAKKTTQVSTEITDWKKIRAPDAKMYNYHGKLVPKSYIEKLAEDWVTFTRLNEDCLCLNEFWLHIKYPRRTWEDWVKAHEVLQRAKEDVKDILSIRRQVGAALIDQKRGLTRFKENVLKYLPIYDDDIKALEKERAEYTKKNEEEERGLTVVIPSGNEVKMLHEMNRLRKENAELKGEQYEPLELV
jgi:hypothetical protein